MDANTSKHMMKRKDEKKREGEKGGGVEKERVKELGRHLVLFHVSMVVLTMMYAFLLCSVHQ